MAVNFLGSCGGALMWHGLGLFSRDRTLSENTAESGHATCGYLALLIIGLFCLVWPYSYYTGWVELPLWPAIVLIATPVCFGLYQDSFINEWRHGIHAVSIVSCCLLLYPVLPHVTQITFY